MRKILLFAMFTIAITAFAEEAAYQYFYACGKLYKTDANATQEQVLDMIDEIEANCPD